MKSIKVLMIGSDLKVQGGIISVIKNYLGYKNWKNVDITYLSTHVDGNPLAKIVKFAKALIKLPRLLSNNNFDIAHIHVSERGSIWRKYMIVNYIKKHSPNTKIVLHHHGAELNKYYETLSDKKKEKVKDLFAKVDTNIVLSNKLITTITDKEPNASVDVLYNAVNTYKENMYNNDGSSILFLGRLGKRKGAYDLLNVIIKNKKYFEEKNIKFYLCGDGEVEEVKNIVKENNLDKVVVHIGWTNLEEKKEIFKDTIINVLPSYNEGLPMTILETMAYGIPNISTNIASIPEVIVNGKNGYLIEPGDVDSLEKNLIDLIENKKKREKISKLSYETILEGFSLDNHIKKVKTIYNKILKK